MPGAFSQNETAANYTALINDSKDNHFSMYQREQKREKILKAEQEIDVVRYAVIKSIEQISNIFDYRVMIPEKYKHTKILTFSEKTTEIINRLYTLYDEDKGAFYKLSSKKEIKY